MEFRVNRRLQLKGYGYLHRFRVDTDQIKIEQRMDIGTKEQSVRDMIGFRPGVRDDMCRFKCGFGIAASDGTSTAVRGNQSFAEVWLTTTLNDLTQLPFPLVL